MSKYTMVSRYGNEIKEVDSERKRDELKALGYKVLEPKAIPIDEMTVPQLEAYAKENNIDLSGCKTKPEKLEKIKEFIEKE